MKRILVFVCLIALPSVLKAGEPVYTVGFVPNSGYSIAHGSLSVSSFSATGLDASTGYRRVVLAIPTSYYAMFDGTTSSATIVSSGFPVTDTTKNLYEFESNGAFRITLPVGIAATTVRYWTKTK